ncbi:MAG TPA: DUF2807 domain-containing protein [Chitinophagaceae bacterium]|nr:DUF2807 domain-containing protein [Chitinophagaceae bacterium]
MRNLYFLSVMLAGMITACSKHPVVVNPPDQQTFPLSRFSRVVTGESFSLQIQRADRFEILATGDRRDLDDLVVYQTTGGILHLEYRNARTGRNPVSFHISLPTLTGMILSGSQQASVSGFGGQNSVIRTVLSGTARCTIQDASANIGFDLQGSSILTVKGATESLYGSLGENARLFAHELYATEVDISASGSSQAHVYPMQSLFAEANDESRIFYQGNPPITQLTTGGNGQILKY